MNVRTFLVSSYAALALNAFANDEATLGTVEVRAQVEDVLGLASSGSEGIVSGARLQSVPLLRAGETLEMVPGLIVTQHAGDGKANQYFLRGFNLDHGTDFATFVAGVPVNMPSHAHGQGYTDLNFLIPELVRQVRYRKGPYYAEEGDFASADAARIDYQRRLPHALAQLTLGENGYRRGLLAGSPELGGGRLLYAFEWFHNDGPWKVAEDYRRLNGVLRYSQGSADDGFALTAMAYRGRWTSTDQIPERAIASGQIDRFGSLDPTAGGRTQRISLAAEWARRHAQGQSGANVWWLASRLDLWSNFQYCLNDLANTATCNTGDQFKQAESRRAGGFDLSHALYDRWGERELTHSFGIGGRSDRLRPVGLYNTRQRTNWNTVREDSVSQRSLNLWAQSEIRWTPWLRTIAGLRGDAYDFRVDSNIAANSGKASDAIVTPKFSLILSPWAKTEAYFNLGHGFHSNDARGTTIRVDPADGVTPVSQVQPLVRTRGQEIGVRSELLPGWQSTLALWQLASASELLFVGDAGTTEASRPSLRRGIEWSNLYTLPGGWAIDADLAWSHARFRDSDPAGRHIPGAVTTTANLGLTYDPQGDWFGAVRFRYFGPRPLIEDNSVRSKSSALTNLRVGYRLSKEARVTLDIYNLFNRKANDIEYWYDSQLAGEGAAVFDRHVHPSEGRTLRVGVAMQF